MGASGAGTATLARTIADRWAVPHADADDYYWIPSSPPFVEKRPERERVALMEALFLPRAAWVCSGSMTGWGRSRARHERWLRGLHCPVLRLDSACLRDVLRDEVLAWGATE